MHSGSQKKKTAEQTPWLRNRRPPAPVRWRSTISSARPLQAARRGLHAVRELQRVDPRHPGTLWVAAAELVPALSIEWPGWMDGWMDPGITRNSIRNS